MSLGILVAIVGGGSILFAYALIERHINQRACPYCRFRVSADALEEQCPRCNRHVGLASWGGPRTPKEASLASTVLPDDHRQATTAPAQSSESDNRGIARITGDLSGGPKS